MTAQLGFRILPAPPRLAPDIIRGFANAASANIADALGRFGYMDPGIRSANNLRLSGPAITVMARPGDNLMVHKAIALAEPGDVIVVNTCGNTGNAVFGELMCRAAVARKLGGIIVDGAIRDVPGIAALKFPAFSRYISPGACDKDGPGEINVPISCGGVVVCPGDIVVGDSDGVTVVPRDHAARVLTLVAELVAREAKRVAEIDAGQVSKPDIDETLRKKGVIE